MKMIEQENAFGVKFDRSIKETIKNHISYDNSSSFGAKSIEEKINDLINVVAILVEEVATQDLLDKILPDERKGELVER